MTARNLSEQINALGCKTIIVLIISGVVSLFIPLEAPAPTQEAAAIWLMNDQTAYVFGWINQIIAMLACGVIYACAAWLVYDRSPLRAVTAWVATLISTVAFLIVKFTAVWSVPMMAKALASGAPESDVAEMFLTVYGPSVAFGLASSLDYLGFALYAAIGLVLFRPLYVLSKSARVAAIGFFIYGILYLLTYLALSISLIGQADVGGVVMSISGLLLVPYIALFFHFREQSGFSLTFSRA